MKKFPKSEWNFADLERAWEVIDHIATEKFNLDYYEPQIEIISSEQMIDNYSSDAMPIMYNHWSFGKQFIRDNRNYTKGVTGLAYEVVINTNPSIAYLLENNTMTMQMLVLAHAVCGHGSFFKNNHLFKEWTDASAIIDYLKFARNYISHCEATYGLREVEDLLDACHSLKYHGIHKYKKPPKLKEEMKAKKRKKWLEYEEDQSNILEMFIAKWKISDPKPEHYSLEENSLSKKINAHLPEENILYFLEKHSPTLKTWQKEIVRIVRKIAQYFYPQMQTKMMNEGWATFCHYHIMEEMEEEGLITEGQFLEFLQSHTSVTCQHDFDSNRYHGINVYSLGFAMFQDIKRICEKPTEEDRKWFPTLVDTDWREATKDAMENYRDESFVLQFLSPKVIRDFKLFTIENEDDGDYYTVVHVHDDDDVLRIRKELARHYDLSYILPQIEVKEYDDPMRVLTLEHTVYDGRLLDYKTAKQTLEYTIDLWGFYVDLVYVDPEGRRIDTVN